MKIQGKPRQETAFRRNSDLSKFSTLLEKQSYKFSEEIVTFEFMKIYETFFV